MIRILIIDDAKELEFIEDLRNGVQGSRNEEVYTEHINPIGFFVGGVQHDELQCLLDAVEKTAGQFWDVALVDLNLHDVDFDNKKEKLHLALSIANSFRQINKSAIVILYSGTLSDHVKELLVEPQVAETAMKKIFHANIAAFSPRKIIELQVIQSLETPSFILTIDRALEKDANIKILTAESEFNGKTFGQLAAAVRCQDKIGMRLTALVAQFGLAAIADLAR